MPFGDAWLRPWLFCNAAEPLLLMAVIVLVFAVGLACIDPIELVPTLAPGIPPELPCGPPPPLPPGAASAGPVTRIAALPASTINDLLNMKNSFVGFPLFSQSTSAASPS
jgi:hypothetical protein